MPNFGWRLGCACGVKGAEADVVGITEPGFCALAILLIHEVQIIGDGAKIRKGTLRRGLSVESKSGCDGG